MSETNFATKLEVIEAVATVNQELSRRIGAVELSLKLDIGNLRAGIDDRLAYMEQNILRMEQSILRVEQNTLSLFAALFAHLDLPTPPLQ